MSRHTWRTRLTVRGRSFIAAGAATFVLGMLAGLTELVRIGVFVLVLPLGSILWIALRRHGLVLTRTRVPTHLPLGDEAEIVLRVNNPASASTGLLLMTEQVPAELGGAIRFAVESLRHGAARRVSYVIDGVRRGKYLVGPLEAQVVDPFGFVERHEVFPGRQTVIVTPRVVRLPHLSLPLGPIGVGDLKARQFLLGSADDATVRDYRRGDDLRRVHWRSSAHHDELMVRSEEQPWRSRATLILDTRSEAYAEAGGDETFEAAVSLVASVGIHLLRRDFSIRLITTDGTPLTREWDDRRTTPTLEGALLESLALVARSSAGSLATELAAGSRPGDLNVVVLGALSDNDVLALDSFNARGTRNLAFTLGGSRGPVYPWVWEQVAPGEDVAAAWRRAALRIKSGRLGAQEPA